MLLIRVLFGFVALCFIGLGVIGFLALSRSTKPKRTLFTAVLQLFAGLMLLVVVLVDD